MLSIYEELKITTDDLLYSYKKALDIILELKKSLLSRIDAPFVDTAETKFLLDSIERKTNKKISTIKNDSKKVLISTNLERKLKFIANLKKDTPTMIYESTAVSKINQRSSSLPILIKMCTEEEKFLTYMIDMLDKHKTHIDKLEKTNKNKRVK